MKMNLDAVITTQCTCPPLSWETFGSLISLDKDVILRQIYRVLRWQYTIAGFEITCLKTMLLTYI